MNKYIKISFAYILGLALILGLIYYIGVKEVILAFTEFNLLFIFPATICFLLTLLLNTLNFKIILSPLRKFNFHELFYYYLVSFSLGAIVPGKIGDFSLAFFLRKKIEIGKTTAVMLIDKAVSFLVMISFSTVLALDILGFKETIYAVSFVLTLLTGGAILINSSRFRSFLTQRLLRGLGKHFAGFHKTLQYYIKNEKRIIFIDFLLTNARLWLQSLVVFFILLGFGVYIDPLVIFMTRALITIIGLIPLTPNGLGLNQVSMVFIFSLCGVQTQITTALSIILLIINYGFISLILWHYLAFRREDKIGEN